MKCKAKDVFCHVFFTGDKSESVVEALEVFGLVIKVYDVHIELLKTKEDEVQKSDLHHELNDNHGQSLDCCLY